jgi:hypothetical protein
VDQQLDGAGPGLDPNQLWAPHYAYKSPRNGRFIALQDESMQGAYWKLTRKPGEKLPDEKW